MFPSIFIRSFAICISWIFLLVLAQGNSSILKTKQLKVTNHNSIISEEIQKLPRDHRNYLGLTLPNDLKVILINDLKATYAAASISISAGSMNDPKELPGLAHFVEHAVFLGNPKYPEENGLDKYVSAHGGFSNAYTSPEETNFHFYCSPKALPEALDRFAQILISPFFNESSLEREVMAVNSENEKNIPSDPHRIHRVESSTADRDHPYSHFRTGNSETLWKKPKANGMDVRQSIMDFHKTYYSSNLMTLAVAGPQSLEKLQKMVEEVFMKVPNRNTTMPFWPQNPYGPEQLQKQVEIVPIGDIRSIKISFPIPYNAPRYDSSPTAYTTGLFFHEGEGSLSSLLKKKNWITGLSSVGSSTSYRGFKTYQVKYGLTKEGLENYQDVICHVFQYFEMIRSRGPQQWYFDEIRDLVVLNSRFEEPGEVISLVTELSTLMHKYPLEKAVAVGSIPPEYEPELITKLMNSFTPENSRIVLVSKEFESKSKLMEKYYGVKYNVENINSTLIQKWQECRKNEKLFFPTKNELIPTKFDLKPRDAEKGIIPRVINDTAFSKIWYLQDNEYLLPKALVKLELFSPLAYVNPLYTSLNSFFAYLVLDSLAEISDSASRADLTYSVQPSQYGIEVTLKGYDHKLATLLDIVIQKIVNFKFTPERFASMKDTFIRHWKSEENEKPVNLASTRLSYLLVEKQWNSHEFLTISDDITVERLQSYVEDFLSRLKFTWFFYGNLTPEESLKMAENSQAHFQKRGTQALLPSQIIRDRDIKVPEGTNWLYKEDQKKDSNSAIGVLFEFGKANPGDRILFGFFSQLANVPAYDQLRTKEQLGYTVYAFNFGGNGFYISVQGSRHPAYVESRIDSFLKDLNFQFQNMTQEEFEKQKASYTIEKSEKPKTLASRGVKLWSQISKEDYKFNRQAVQLAELESMSLDDFKRFSNKLIGTDSGKTTRISIHITSTAEGGAGNRVEEVADIQEIPGRVEIKDVTEWKKRCELYPSSRPVPSTTSLARSNFVHFVEMEDELSSIEKIV